MNLTDLIKAGNEHSHQRAFFAYLSVAENNGWNVADDWASGMGIEAAKSGRTNDVGIPDLKYIHAIPNGGLRDKITAGKLKAEGVKSGVPDVFVPMPIVRNNVVLACGLYIEFKRPKSDDKKKGVVAETQTDWHTYLLGAGYAVVVCYSVYAAIDELKTYLGR